MEAPPRRTRQRSRHRDPLIRKQRMPPCQENFLGQRRGESKRRGSGSRGRGGTPLKRLRTAGSSAVPPAGYGAECRLRRCTAETPLPSPSPAVPLRPNAWVPHGGGRQQRHDSALGHAAGGRRAVGEGQSPDLQPQPHSSAGSPSGLKEKLCCCWKGEGGGKNGEKERSDAAGVGVGWEPPEMEI